MSNLDTVNNYQLDLQAYLNRIGYTGATDATLETLRGIHAAHVFSTPFENLNIYLGKPIEIALPSIFEKLVEQRRGGYCFEMNGIFSAALEQLGFQLQRLQGRVWLWRPNMPEFSKDNPPLRSHMLLKVTIDGQHYIADTGFGGAGIMEPLLLQPGLEQTQYGETYRIIEDPDFGYMMQYRHTKHGWSNMYSFDLTPHHRKDYIHANYFTCHSPDSWFTQLRIATKPTHNGRYVLQENSLKLNQAHEPVLEKELQTVADYQDILTTHFGITLTNAEIEQAFAPFLKTKQPV